MAAIGRDPLTHNLDLQNSGVKLDAKGAIQVNNTYQTSVSNIYAVGDVTDKVQLTPVALAEGHWLADTLFGNITRPAPSYENIPTAVFSDPNISTIGLSEDEALKQGHKIKVFKSTFTPMKNILPQRAEKTLMKMIVCQNTDKILGLHMIGLDAAEMLQGFAVAIVAGCTKADFDRTIGIHPTSAEELVTMRQPSYLKP
jgi:glutathione reductase (NADPH)